MCKSLYKICNPRFIETSFSNKPCKPVSVSNTGNCCGLTGAELMFALIVLR